MSLDNFFIDNLPHRRMEAWKWTDVRGAVFNPNSGSNLKSGKISGMTSVCEPQFSLPIGLCVTRETTAPSGSPPSDSPMGKLATNFSGDAYVILVPAGFDGHIGIRNLQNGHGRIIFKLGVNSKLSVVEIHDSNVPRFINLDMRFEMGQGAKLTRTISHNDHKETTRIATAQVNALASAEITQYALSFGGGLTRFETRIASLGENLKAEIYGAYLLGDKRHCDMTSYIDLGAKNAHIHQSVKGVVTGKARGVFQGKFHVRRSAQFTDANMRHDAIMLSDTCQVRAKPELEIYADDVACAHGNTVGALDESALFYMRSRGISAAQARALLTQAFVAESFDGMVDNSDFMSKIKAWLEQKT